MIPGGPCSARKCLLSVGSAQSRSRRAQNFEEDASVKHASSLIAEPLACIPSDNQRCRMRAPRGEAGDEGVAKIAISIHRPTITVMVHRFDSKC